MDQNLKNSKRTSQERDKKRIAPPQVGASFPGEERKKLQPTLDFDDSLNKNRFSSQERSLVFPL
jgi:hypothetical protein